MRIRSSMYSSHVLIKICVAIIDFLFFNISIHIYIDQTNF